MRATIAAIDKTHVMHIHTNFIQFNLIRLDGDADAEADAYLNPHTQAHKHLKMATFQKY